MIWYPSPSEPAYIRSARIGAHGSACVCGSVVRYEGRDIACHVAPEGGVL